MASAYATIALGRHPLRPVHRRRGQEPRRHGRVRAQGRRRAGVRRRRHRRHHLRHAAGRRVRLRQGLGQAARPADRRQDRDVDRQQVGVVHRLHAEHRDRGVAQPAVRGRQGQDSITTVRQDQGRQDAQGGHGWLVAGVPLGVVHEERLRAARLRRRRAVPGPRERGRQGQADRRRRRRRPTPEETTAPDRAGARGGRRPRRARGQARGRRVRGALQRRPRPVHHVGAVRHGDGRSGDPHRSRRGHAARAREQRHAGHLDRPEGARDAGAPAPTRRPDADPGADPLIHGEERSAAPRRSFRAPSVHSRFRRWPPAG